LLGIDREALGSNPYASRRYFDSMLFRRPSRVSMSTSHEIETHDGYRSVAANV